MDDKRELYAADLTTATWRKSTFTGNNGQCVEIAQLPGGAIAIRDSKSPTANPSASPAPNGPPSSTASTPANSAEEPRCGERPGLNQPGHRDNR